MIAAAFFIAGTQSGEVINVTNISPSSNSSISFGSAITCTFPVETPGLAGKPLTKIFLVLFIETVDSFDACLLFLFDQTVSGRACTSHNRSVRASSANSMSM